MRFQKGSTTSLEYPLTAVPANNGSSRLVNPMIGNPRGLKAPLMPGELGFDAELHEVLEVRLDVTNGRYPADFMARHHPRADFDPMVMPEPLARKGLSIDDPQGLANVVHMDSPIDMPLAVLMWLVGQTDVRLKESVSDHVDFLGAVPYVIENLADAVKRNLIRAFEAKFYFGRPRPEEVLEADTAILFSKFTAYPEGAPCHPAYPAGHGAAAAAVKVFDKMFHLLPWHKRVIYDCAYHWSQYRTLAGVHYATDNLAGLEVGGLKA